MRQDEQDYKALMRIASIPIPTDKPDLAAITKQIHAEHEKSKHAMMAHLKRRRDAQVLRQIEAAARYNAAHEQLHMHSTGKSVTLLLTLPFEDCGPPVTHPCDPPFEPSCDHPP